MKIILITFIFLFTVFQSANAGGIPGVFTLNLEIQGKVIRVLDGDTIEVKTLPAKIVVYEVPIRVRLINIDAPEKKQPLDAGQEINLKPCSPDNPLLSLIRKQIATAALSVACSRRTARRPAASWFSLALRGYMNVTTQINHYQLCNGKRRNKNEVYGLTVIRFHRGNGDINRTDARCLSNPSTTLNKFQAVSRF